MKNRPMKPGRSPLLPALLLCLLGLLALAGGTYAWFTFRSYTRATALTGTVGSGDGTLLISADPAGPFALRCDLRPETPDAALLPVSTADLDRFFLPRLQDGEGYVLGYAPGNDTARESSLRGTVYLRSEGKRFAVYLLSSALEFGSDPQALSALRLGLRFHTRNGVETVILRLDELAEGAAVEARLTVPDEGLVVAAVDGQGLPTYVADPALPLSAACAGGTAESPQPGLRALCQLEAGETAQVDYMVYLEGCDTHCINAVQARELALRLGFAGVPQAEMEAGT